MIYLFDKHDTFISTISAFECIYNRNMQSWTLNVTMEHMDNVNKGYKVGIFDKDDIFRYFVIKDIEDDYNDNLMQLQCDIEYTTLSDTIVEDKRVTNGTCLVALEKLLEGTNFIPGIVEPGTLENINFYFVNRYTGLINILNTYDAEIDYRVEFTGNKITKKIIDIVHSVGEETGLRCTWDTNITSLHKKVHSDNHYTVLYGRGKSLETEGGGNSRLLTFDGVEWGSNHPLPKPKNDKFLEHKESIAKYGRIEGIYENGNIDDKEELLNATYKKILTTKDPNITYTTTVKDIRHIEGFEHYNYKFGDTIHIIDEESDLIITARIHQEEYDIINIDNINIALGDAWLALTDQTGDTDEDKIKDIVDSVVGDIDTSIDDSKYPATLPDTPVLAGRGGLDSIAVSWTYESKNYYYYELYASKTNNFTPSKSTLVFEGQASHFILDCKPKERWYFKCRAKNTHNEYTSFSGQLTVDTTKIDDGAVWIENGAIGELLVGTLRLDRGWIGKLDAELLDVKGRFRVIDGNGQITFEVDSYGRIHMDVSSLKINGKWAVDEDTLLNAKQEMSEEIGGVRNTVQKIEGDYVGQSQMTQTFNNFEYKFNKTCNNLVYNSTGKSKNVSPWSIYRYSNASAVTLASANTEWTGYEDALQMWTSNIGGIDGGAIQKVKVTPNKLHTLVCYIAGHRSDKQVIITNKSNNAQLVASSVVGHLNGGSDINNWRKIVLKFTPVEDEIHIRLKLARGLEFDKQDAWFWVKNLVLVDGDFPDLEWRPHNSELMNNVTSIDGEGVLIQQEGSSFTRIGNRELYQANENGERTISMRLGGQRFYKWEHNKAYLGGTSPTRINNDDNYGISIFGSSNANFIDIGFSQVSGDVQPGTIDSWIRFARDNKIIVRKPFDVNGFGIKSSNSLYEHQIYNNDSASRLSVFGDAGVRLGSRVSADGYRALEIIEDGNSPSKNRVESFAHWNFNNYTMSNMRTTTTLQAQSEYLKHRTKDINKVHGVNSFTVDEIRYADRKEYCTSYYISTSDNDNSEYNNKYISFIEMPQILSENIELDYHVNISKLSFGDYRVLEKNPYFFIIESEKDNFRFTFEVVSKLIEKPYAYTVIASNQYDAEESPIVEEEEVEMHSKYALMDDEEIDVEMLKKEKQLWKLYKR